jgi:uncharacterized protein involved in exopolysaccharide biosynthesis
LTPSGVRQQAEMIDFRAEGLALTRNPAPELSARQDDLDLWAFTSFVLSRWRVFALACGISLPVVLVVSLLLPEKYTATASILIEPPAGNDPRGSTAVSPVYLESLKTYEHFASSDSLFAQALEHLHLRQNYANVPIETLKRRVLHVSKPRDTKVLEVSATMPDPAKARDLARYLANETVKMNQALDRSANSELTVGGNVVLGQALERLQRAKAERADALAKEPIANLEAEVAEDSDLRSRIGRDLSQARVELAAYEARETAESKRGSTDLDRNAMTEAIAAAKAEVLSLQQQSADLDAKMLPTQTLLERRKHDRELLDKELQTAQAQYEIAATHNSDVLASVAFRGERLEIIDPGVLPERPSFPNIPLNLAIACLASVCGSILCLAVLFSYKRRSSLFAYRASSRS